MIHNFVDCKNCANSATRRVHFVAGNAFANDLLAYFFKATNNDQAIKTLVQDQNKTTKAGLCIFAPKNQAPPEVNKISKQPKIT